jgi:hypothetical protein
VITGLIRFPDDNTSGERLVDNKPQLVISVINKNYDLVLIYKKIFGGNIGVISNDRFIWSICTKDQVSNFINYVKKHYLRAYRHKRTFLSSEFFELVEMDAHKAPKNSMLSKA